MSDNQDSEQYAVLVVDDEELVRTLVGTILSKLGYACLTAINGVDALEKMKGGNIDAVITDVKMPQMDGILLTRELTSKYPGIPIMVMTAFDEEYSGGTALTMGAREFIKKPFSLDEFAIRLQKMMRDTEALRQARKGDKAEKVERVERPERIERSERVEPTTRFDPSERIERPPEKTARSSKDVDEEIQKMVRESGMKKPAKKGAGAETAEGAGEEDVGDLMDELEKTLKDF